MRVLVVLLLVLLLSVVAPRPAFAELVNGNMLDRDFKMPAVPPYPIRDPVTNDYPATKYNDGYYLRADIRGTYVFTFSNGVNNANDVIPEKHCPFGQPYEIVVNPSNGKTYCILRVDFNYLNALKYIGKEPYSLKLTKIRDSFAGDIFLNPQGQEVLRSFDNSFRAGLYLSDYNPAQIAFRNASGTSLQPFARGDVYIDTWNLVFKGCLQDGFITCLKDKLGGKFPFDMLKSPVIATRTCPAIVFFEDSYNICWLLEMFKWFKYPVAVSLCFKLYSHI